MQSLFEYIAMSDQEMAPNPGPPEAQASTSPLHKASSESSYGLSGATSGVSQRSAVTTSTDPNGQTSAPTNRQTPMSQTSRRTSLTERALAGVRHNGEVHEESPWARKTILSLGT